jgi:phospholipid-transporting ATPase|tara:strand:- start:103 stop:450 length:348 start_codon:yes stop_codon:yes gene_type:complete
MEQQTNNLTLVLFIIQFLFSAIGAMFSQVFDQQNLNSSYYLDIQTEADSEEFFLVQLFPQLNYALKLGTWILLLANFVPVSLLVTVEMVKFIQGLYIEWDSDLTSVNSGIQASVQ